MVFCVVHKISVCFFLFSFSTISVPAADATDIKFTLAEMGVESSLLCFCYIQIWAINTRLILRVLQMALAVVIWMLKRPFKQELCCVCWRGAGVNMGSAHSFNSSKLSCCSQLIGDLVSTWKPRDAAGASAFLKHVIGLMSFCIIYTQFAVNLKPQRAGWSPWINK